MGGAPRRWVAVSLVETSIVQREGGLGGIEELWL